MGDAMKLGIEEMMKALGEPAIVNAMAEGRIRVEMGYEVLSAYCAEAGDTDVDQAFPVLTIEPVPPPPISEPLNPEIVRAQNEHEQWKLQHQAAEQQKARDHALMVERERREAGGIGADNVERLKEDNDELQTKNRLLLAEIENEQKQRRGIPWLLIFATGIIAIYADRNWETILPWAKRLLSPAAYISGV